MTNRNKQKYLRQSLTEKLKDLTGEVVSKTLPIKKIIRKIIIAKK